MQRERRAFSRTAQAPPAASLSRVRAGCQGKAHGAHIGHAATPSPGGATAPPLVSLRARKINTKRVSWQDNGNEYQTKWSKGSNARAEFSPKAHMAAN